MSLLRSYSFYEEVPYTVWKLFEDAGMLGTKLDYILEIIEEAQNGNIDFNKEFNLGGYINTIKWNQERESYRHGKKIKSICSDFDEWEEDCNFITEDIVSTYATRIDAYRELEDDDEIKYAVKEIKRLSRQILIEHSICIYRCTYMALKGMPDSVMILKDLVSKDTHVGDLLKIILSSGYKLEELFPDEVK